MQKLFATFGAVILVILAFNLVLGGVCTQYDVEFWGSVVEHHPVHVEFWKCALAGMVLGEFAIPIAAVTWLISAFI